MTKSIEFTTAWAAVQKITDLTELQSLLSHVTQLSQNRARVAFAWGQKVKFFARGRWHEGTVEGFNTKTIGVRTPAGPWRIPPAMLQAA